MNTLLINNESHTELIKLSWCKKNGKKNFLTEFKNYSSNVCLFTGIKREREYQSLGCWARAINKSEVTGSIPSFRIVVYTLESSSRWPWNQEELTRKTHVRSDNKNSLKPLSDYSQSVILIYELRSLFTLSLSFSLPFSRSLLLQNTRNYINIKNQWSTLYIYIPSLNSNLIRALPQTLSLIFSHSSW